MDRQIVYIGQTPEDTDLLLTNMDAYFAVAKLAAALLGTNTLLNNLVCAPTGPATLTVNVGPGEIYSLQNVDDTAYGSIAADTTNQIYKQGIILTTTNLSCPAPVTVGNSINYLVQIGFSEVDTGSVVLPYYDSDNPAVPFTGPNNNPIPQNTIRQNSVNIEVKAGTSAPTGTQTTPSPDAGFTGAYVVTVANGQATITSGDISLYPGAPFIVNRVATNSPKFRAYLNSAQAIPTGVFTKVQLDAKSFDTNSNFDITTNYRFTPKISGYYQINASIQFEFDVGDTAVIYAIDIFKNGAQYSGIEQHNTIPSVNQGVPMSDIVFFNGTTDYLELFVKHNAGANRNLTNNGILTFMSGSLLP